MAKSGFMFAKSNDKEPSQDIIKQSQLPWKVLIVDDDESIHTVTDLVLDDFLYRERPLQILNAYSAKEAKVILREQSDIAVAFLDVVMENDTAGLELVHFIRNELHNDNIRLILRTGQPGVAPESEVITTYDIDDYKDKTELTNVKLKTSVHNALKSYENIMLLKDNATKLEKYKNMFNSATDFIFIVDSNHKIVEANQAFLKAVGKEHHEIIDKPVFEVFYDALHHKDIEENINRSMHGENITYESEMEFDALGRRFVDVEFFPYYDKGDELSAAVVNLKDITTDVIQREQVTLLKTSQIENYEQTILSLVDAIEQRDSFTAGHTVRVAEYSKKIAQAMNINTEEIELLYKAAMLHDIGKISTPDAILLKPGKFTTTEYNLIKNHLEAGYELLKKVGMYKELAEIMKYHHERYDGGGYPNGFKGDEIPILGYIMAAADAFDAMTTNRIYKKRKEIDTALLEMQELKYKQFHPDVVDAAVVALKDSAVELSNQLPTTKMEKARFAYFFRDSLTKTYNKDYLTTELAINKDKYKVFYYLQLHKMSQYNKKSGWATGDTLLKNIANALHDLYPKSSLFRIHGDDFIILSTEELSIDIDALNRNLLGLENETFLTIQSHLLKDMHSLNAENFEDFLTD